MTAGSINHLIAPARAKYPRQPRRVICQNVPFALRLLASQGKRSHHGGCVETLFVVVNSSHMEFIFKIKELQTTDNNKRVANNVVIMKTQKVLNSTKNPPEKFSTTPDKGEKTRCTFPPLLALWWPARRSPLRATAATRLTPTPSSSRVRARRKNMGMASQRALVCDGRPEKRQ